MATDCIYEVQCFHACIAPSDSCALISCRAKTLDDTKAAGDDPALPCLASQATPLANGVEQMPERIMNLFAAQTSPEIPSHFQSRPHFRHAYY